MTPDLHSDEAITERQTRIMLLMESIRLLAIAILVVLTVLMAGGVWLYQSVEESRQTNKATQVVLCDAVEKADLDPLDDCSVP